jgi:hypothetical protein
VSTAKRHAYSGHFTSESGRRIPQTFTCYLCIGGTDRLTGQEWNVGYGQSVQAAQQLHHLTHPLALRQAVETLVRGFDTGVVVVVQAERSPGVAN